MRCQLFTNNFNFIVAGKMKECECVDFMVENNICKHIHFCEPTRMKSNFVIINDSSQIKADNIAIAMSEPYIAHVNDSSLDDKLALIKLKADAFLGYLSKSTLVDADFNDEILRTWNRNLDQMLEDITSQDQRLEINFSP